MLRHIGWQYVMEITNINHTTSADQPSSNAPSYWCRKKKKKMSGDYYLQDQNGQNCMCTSMLLTASQIALNSVEAYHYTSLYMCEWERGDKRSKMHTRWPMFLSGVWTHLAWSRESQGLVLVMEWSPSTIMCSKCQQVQIESE